MTRFEQSIDELTRDEVTILSMLADNDNDIEVEVKNVFEDDHLDCVTVSINNITFTFWWIGPEEVGALYYWKDPRAQKVIRKLIRDGIENWEFEHN